MPDGEEPKSGDSLPEKDEERDTLTKVTALAPLFSLILQGLELLLKVLGVIK